MLDTIDLSGSKDTCTFNPLQYQAELAKKNMSSSDANELASLSSMDFSKDIAFVGVNNTNLNNAMLNGIISKDGVVIGQHLC